MSENANSTNLSLEKSKRILFKISRKKGKIFGNPPDPSNKVGRWTEEEHRVFINEVINRGTLKWKVVNKIFKFLIV
jgi:hypothetical protein